MLRCFQYSEHYRRSFLPSIGGADARSRRTMKRLPEMVLMVSYSGQLPEARVYTCLARGPTRFVWLGRALGVGRWNTGKERVSKLLSYA